jgi:hypothetical protein
MSEPTTRFSTNLKSVRCGDLRCVQQQREHGKRVFADAAEVVNAANRLFPFLTVNVRSSD